MRYYILKDEIIKQVDLDLSLKADYDESENKNDTNLDEYEQVKYVNKPSNNDT